jgi:hypothetical protein
VVPQPDVLEDVQAVSLKIKRTGTVLADAPADVEVMWKQCCFSPIFRSESLSGLGVREAFT